MSWLRQPRQKNVGVAPAMTNAAAWLAFRQPHWRLGQHRPPRLRMRRSGWYELPGQGRAPGVEGLGDMSARYDCKDAAQRAAGISEAAAALRKGELAVLPTDTVYGLAADAFTPEAVTALLAAKGRGRQMPPPVLVGSRRAALALVEDVSSSG